MENILFFFKEEAGATAAEYSIMAALIAAVIIGSVVVFGKEVNGLFDLCLEEMKKFNI